MLVKRSPNGIVGKLPSKIYLRRDNVSDSHDPWVALTDEIVIKAVDSPAELAELDEKAIVYEYTLKRIVEVSSQAIIVTKKIKKTEEGDIT